MKIYLIIGAIAFTFMIYISHLKYTNTKLQNEVSSLIAEKVMLEQSYETQKTFAKIQQEKNIQLSNDLNKINEQYKTTSSQSIKVDDCNVKILNVDTNKETATGVPLYLGNIGGM